MIREKIQEAMKEKAIKAVELSTATGINKGSLSQYFNGKRELRIESIEKILAYLDLELKTKSNNQ